MVRELIIHSNTVGVEIALLEDKRLMEYHVDRHDQSDFSVGDVYLGRIKKLNPGLNAAFVDIGHKKDAFIHYSDLSPNLLSLKKFTQSIKSAKQTALLDNFELEPEISKDGKIQEVLDRNDWVITQIMKEAISTKGPRMTCEVTIPGRYVVLAPFANNVGVSKKITDSAERERLIAIVEQVRPKNFGIVLRTNARNQGAERIKKDIQSLIDKWEKLKNGLVAPESPRRLLSEMSKSFMLVRDMLNDSFERVICDNPKLYDKLSAYLENKAPKHSKKLELYKGMRPIFDEFDVTRQLKNSFGKNVTLKSGAYLVVEHTEALRVIDINSGPKINRELDQDTNAFNVNLEAVPEIARQMRVRDIGGIIVIDFIDMKSAEYRHKIYQAMEAAMKQDRAKHSILPISKFGLMEITRQRVRSQTDVNMEKLNDATTCEGILPEVIVSNIEKEIASLRDGYQAQSNKYNLSVHPFVASYLTKGMISPKWSWFFQHKVWVQIMPNDSLDINEFYVLHQDRDKQKLKQ